jgi:hypothetical protein
VGDPVAFVSSAIQSVASPWRRAGGGPAAAHFLCFAKESKQRKATAASCPCGVPENMGAKAGSAKTRLRLRHLRFFFRFSTHVFGSSQRKKASPARPNLAVATVCCLTRTPPAPFATNIFPASPRTPSRSLAGSVSFRHAPLHANRPMRRSPALPSSRRRPPTKPCRQR